MKYFFLIGIFFLFWGKFNRIAEMNSLKEKAADHYQKKEFQKCITLYEKLLLEYKETDEAVKLNLANSYFQLKRFNSAIDNYRSLTASKEPLIKSTAYLQLGVIYSSNNKKELGLSYFKEALKSMPENEKARYNFELLKKEQEHQREISPEKKRENADGKNKTTYKDSEESKKTNNGSDKKETNPSQNDDEGSGDEDNEENTGGEEEDELQSQDNGDKETDALTSKRLDEMNINERQARMILKTMKNSEVQYIQQRRKIISAKLVVGRPDW